MLFCGKKRRTEPSGLLLSADPAARDGNGARVVGPPVRKPAPPPGHARVPDVVGGRGVPRQRGATDSHSDGSSIAADRLFRRPCGSQWLRATATTSRQRRLTSYDDFHLTIELELDG